MLRRPLRESNRKRFSKKLIQEVMKYPGLGRTEMPEIIREEPVSLEDFQQMISKGLTKELKDKIFKGGVTKEARPLVWRNILGLADEVDLAIGKKNFHGFESKLLTNHSNEKLFWTFVKLQFLYSYEFQLEKTTTTISVPNGKI